MKVLFLNYEYPPLGGGAANATEYLLREYAGMPDVEVSLVTSAIGSEYVREEIGAGVVVHRLPIGKDPDDLHHQSRGNLLSYSWKAYLFARKLLRKEEGFDLIHAFFTVPCGFQAMLLSAESRIPYVVSLRGADVPGYSERFTAIYALIRPLVRLIWRRAGAVVSNSAGLRELALRTDPEREIPIIPNGVDTGQFFPAERKGVDDGTVRVLVVSRLTPRKGIRFLIRALPLLPESVRLVVAGDGDERPVLEALAAESGVAERVSFMGGVPHDALPDVYREADIFCLPSLNEGMSNTVLEAIASGLPVVATVTGGTDELVMDGRNGYLVEMRSSEALAEGIGKLAADAALRGRMGKASRSHAESMDWSSVAVRYADTYRSLVGSRGR